MKATVVFLTFAGALALASVVPQQPERKVADKDFLQKQHNILKLFVNVHQEQYDQEEYQTGNNFDPRSQIDNFSNTYAVKEFINAYKKGMLPRGEVFNIHYYNHLEEAIKLFDLMFFAKDYNTFYQVCCWAKSRMNEGQYTYALAVAVLHRPDCQGIQLPPMSEIAPHFYVDNHAIHHANELKQEGQTSATILANYTGQYPNWEHNNEQEQPVQQQQQQPSHHRYPYECQSTHQMQEFQQQYNPEGKLSYYTEDTGLNQLYAQVHLLQPFWFNTKKYGIKFQNEGYGENVYYMYQQALARYNLERMCHGMPPVTPVSYNQPIEPGYSPNVQYGNGQHFPARPENMVISQQGNQYYLMKVLDFERRLRDAIDAEYVYATDGSKVPLTAENGIEILGKLIQSNADAVNNDYYGFQYGYYGFAQLLKKLVSNIVDPYYQYGAAPGCIENYNTALRDPVMYQIMARIVSLFQAFKNKIQPYKQDQLYYQGAKIESVECDKMITYFDNYNINLYNSLVYQKGQQAEKYDYEASLLRLNNKPFTYHIKIHSDKDEDAIVRVFIGPKYNAQGQPMSIEQAKNYFVEIDRFVTQLKNGENSVERNSKQSNVFVDDHDDTHTLFRKVEQAQQGGEPFYYNENHSYHVGMPERLMLPMGSKSGQHLVMFVIVNKYEPSTSHTSQTHNYYQVQDNHAQGYPFDRHLNENLIAHCPNCYYKEITVFYKTQSEVNTAQ